MLRLKTRRSSASSRELPWIATLPIFPNPKSSNTRSISVHPSKDPCNPRLRSKLNNHAPQLLITTAFDNLRQSLLLLRVQPMLRFVTDLPDLKAIPITTPLLLELKDHRAARQLA